MVTNLILRRVEDEKSALYDDETLFLLRGVDKGEEFFPALIRTARVLASGYFYRRAYVFHRTQAQDTGNCEKASLCFLDAMLVGDSKPSADMENVALNFNESATEGLFVKDAACASKARFANLQTDASSLFEGELENLMRDAKLLRSFGFIPMLTLYGFSSVYKGEYLMRIFSALKRIRPAFVFLKSAANDKHMEDELVRLSSILTLYLGGSVFGIGVEPQMLRAGSSQNAVLIEGAQDATSAAAVLKEVYKGDAGIPFVDSFKGSLRGRGEYALAGVRRFFRTLF